MSQGGETVAASGFGRWNAFAFPADVVPAFLVAALVATTFIWNAFVGLTFVYSAQLLFGIAGVFFAITAYYRAYRRNERILAEIPLYVGLWLLFSFFATRLTYLALTTGAPVQDELFLRADALLGFDWAKWSAFVQSNQAAAYLLKAAYASAMVQPVTTILVSAVWAPKGRNQELLLAIWIAIALTISCYAAMPAYGPLSDLGMNPDLYNVIAGVRSGHHDPLYLNGIVCFPSFHTVMAIVFTWATRGTRAFVPYCVLNLVMLFSIPTFGDHYLVDMVGGTAVAVLCMAIARRFTAFQLRQGSIARLAGPAC